MGSGEENYRVYMIYIKIRPPHTLSQKYIFSMTKCVSIKKPVILSFTTLTGFLVRQSSQRQNAQGG